MQCYAAQRRDYAMSCFGYNGESGGTRKTINYAAKHGGAVHNVLK